MARENGFVRYVRLVYDKAAGKRMQEEAALGMDKAGQEGAKELEAALKEGGKKGARALTTALEKEYRARIAASRRAFAEGLTDEAAYKRAGEEAAAAYNRGLSAGIKRLQSSTGGLTDLAATQLSGRFKIPAGGSVGAAGGLAAIVGGAFPPLAALFAADRIKTAAFELRDLGQASQEMGSKFQTTFGAAAPQVQTFLDGWAELAGLNETVAHNFSATAGAVAQGMGVTGAASAEMSKQVLALAGDLASFNNKPIEETFRAVIGGLTGERDSLKQYGIVVQQSEVDQLALANSHKQSTAELTAQEKALASMQLMVQKAGVQVGDLDRTQNSDANTTRRLTAEFQNAKIELANGLRPAFSEILSFVDQNSSAFGTLAQFLGVVLVAAVRILTKGLTFLGGVVLADLDGAIGLVTFTLSGFVSAAGLALEGIAKLSDVTGLGDAEAWHERADAINATAAAMRKFSAESFRNAGNTAGNAFTGLFSGGSAGSAGGLPKVTSTTVTTPRTGGTGTGGSGGSAGGALGAKIVGVTADGTPVAAPVIAASVVVPEGAIQKAQDFFSSVEGMAAEAGGIMADHFTNAFGILFRDIDNAGDAFKELWKGVGAGIIGAVGAEAKSRAGLNAVKAMEALAMALWESLHGNFAAAGGYAVSAAKFTGIAAAYGALAGGSAAITGGGGGGAGATNFKGDPGLSTFDASRGRGQPVNVYVNPFDPANPVQATQLGKAVDLHVHLSRPAWAVAR